MAANVVDPGAPTTAVAIIAQAPEVQSSGVRCRQDLQILLRGALRFQPSFDEAHAAGRGFG